MIPYKKVCNKSGSVYYRLRTKIQVKSTVTRIDRTVWCLSMRFFVSQKDQILKTVENLIICVSKCASHQTCIVEGRKGANAAANKQQNQHVAFQNGVYFDIRKGGCYGINCNKKETGGITMKKEFL